MSPLAVLSEEGYLIVKKQCSVGLGLRGLRNDDDDRGLSRGTIPLRGRQLPDPGAPAAMKVSERVMWSEGRRAPECGDTETDADAERRQGKRERYRIVEGPINAGEAEYRGAKAGCVR